MKRVVFNHEIFDGPRDGECATCEAIIVCDEVASSTYVESLIVRDSEGYLVNVNDYCFDRMAQAALTLWHSHNSNGTR